jgi:hypothetical protein
MNFRFLIPDLAKALSERKLPTMVAWNRLEVRPRTDDMRVALRAEVHDALFMLTRQWQMGEFRGDDAGSPISVTALASSAPVARYRAGTAQATEFDAATPLEARIESRPISFERAGQPIALDIRLQMGRIWLKLIATIGNFAEAYIEAYPVDALDPADPRQAPASAHPDVAQSFAAAAGRRMDGWKFLRHLEDGGAASDGVNAGGSAGELDAMAQTFQDWFARQYAAPPASGDAWQPERLEYRFELAGAAAGGEKVLLANEFSRSGLDWYSCDIEGAAAPLRVPPGVTEQALALLPVSVSFPGMPDLRWWAFEDGRVNLGGFDVSTTDLGRMAYLEFAMLYANDWFLAPLTLPSGSLATVRGIAVTNVFNERFWVRPAGDKAGDWRRWTMFTNSRRGAGREIADTGLFVAPVTPKIQEGPPLDDVLFIRDEMANLAWGIEQRVPLPDGRSRPGAEVARELRHWFERRVPKPAPAGPPLARLRYDAMSSVAEHWIPFLSVRKVGSQRQTLLQRGSMLRFIEGEAGRPRRITPRSAILREGLDGAAPQPYFLGDEEVPRAGVQVTRGFRRARGRFGRTFVWIGMRKRIGRGEGQSGLAFDRLILQDDADGPS